MFLAANLQIRMVSEGALKTGVIMLKMTFW